MTKYIFKIAIAAVGIVLMTNTATANDLSRKVSKSFDVSKGDKLLIDTKFGSVNVRESNSDKVTFNVTINVEENGKRAQKLLEDIKIVLEKQGNTVKGITEFPKIKNNKDISIDYEVSAPAYMAFNLIHKFGDTYIEHFDGKCDIELKFGNLKADQLPFKGNEFELKYVDIASIGVVTDARVDIGYSDMTVSKASFLKIESGYSEIEIESVHSLVIEAKYDEYEIGNAENISIEAKYTDFEIGEVRRKFTYDGSYGDLDIDKVANGFEEIRLDVKYNDCEIDLPENASYKIDGSASFAHISFDKGNFKGRYHKGMNSLNINGQVGDKASSKIFIDTSYGDIEL